MVQARGYLCLSVALVGAVRESVVFAPISAPSRLTTLFAKKARGKGFGKEVVEEPAAAVVTPAAKVEAPKPAAPAPMNDGQKALEQMRRERAEAKDAELRRVRDLITTDQQVQETPAAIPEKVAQRMGKRMLPFVGLPLFLGMGSFVFFWYMATYQNMEYQPALVAATTIALLVVGLLVRGWWCGWRLLASGVHHI